MLYHSITFMANSSVTTSLDI